MPDLNKVEPIGPIPGESSDTPLHVETPIERINRELAEMLNNEALQNPASPYAGKKIGIANGQVIVIADDWSEVAKRLRQIEPDPLKCYCIEAGVDYSVVHEIY